MSSGVAKHLWRSYVARTDATGDVIELEEHEIDSLIDRELQQFVALFRFSSARESQQAADVPHTL